jgi:hypothetical protein
VRARVSPRPVAVAVALQGGEGAALLLPSVAVGGWSSFVAVASPVSPFPFAASGFRLFEGGTRFRPLVLGAEEIGRFCLPPFSHLVYHSGYLWKETRVESSVAFLGDGGFLDGRNFDSGFGSSPTWRVQF